MNREETKRLLPLIQAFVDGKTIQFHNGSEWLDLNECPHFSFPSISYRIKPEPKLRPWTKNEAPKFFMMRRKMESAADLIGLRFDGSAYSGPNGWQFGLLWLLEHGIRITEDGTEHPCGVLEAQP